MAGWWQRARVVSVVGAGALILGGGGTAVTASAAEQDPVEPPDSAGAKLSVRLVAGGQQSRPRTTVHAGDVLRFRVKLAGQGRRTQLAVATTPMDAPSSVGCDSRAAAPDKPASHPQVCEFDEVAGGKSVDVTMRVPREADEVGVIAVAHMRDPGGVQWIRRMADVKLRVAKWPAGPAPAADAQNVTVLPEVAAPGIAGGGDGDEADGTGTSPVASTGTGVVAGQGTATAGGGVHSGPGPVATTGNGIGNGNGIGIGDDDDDDGTDELDGWGALTGPGVDSAVTSVRKPGLAGDVPTAGARPSAVKTVPGEQQGKANPAASTAEVTGKTSPNGSADAAKAAGAPPVLVKYPNIGDPAAFGGTTTAKAVTDARRPGETGARPSGGTQAQRPGTGQIGTPLHRPVIDLSGGQWHGWGIIGLGGTPGYKPGGAWYGGILVYSPPAAPSGVQVNATGSAPAGTQVTGAGTQGRRPVAPVGTPPRRPVDPAAPVPAVATAVSGQTVTPGKRREIAGKPNSGSRAARPPVGAPAHVRPRKAVAVPRPVPGAPAQPSRPMVPAAGALPMPVPVPAPAPVPPAIPQVPAPIQMPMAQPRAGAAPAPAISPAPGQAQPPGTVIAPGAGPLQPPAQAQGTGQMPVPGQLQAAPAGPQAHPLGAPLPEDAPAAKQDLMAGTERDDPMARSLPAVVAVAALLLIVVALQLRLRHRRAARKSEGPQDA